MKPRENPNNAREWSGSSVSPAVAEAVLRGALARCARRGEDRVAIYGGGRHTRALGAALADPPVEIVGIIDDDASLRRRRLWNFPVLSRETASQLARAGLLDAVIVSSDTVEARLIERSAPIAHAGASVYALYAEGEESCEDEPAVVLVWPAVRDRAMLGDVVARLAWYLSPVRERVSRVVVPVEGMPAEPMKPGDLRLPEYLDESLGTRIEAVADVFELVPTSDAEALANARSEADRVLVWRSDRAGEATVRAGQEVYDVDHESQRYGSARFAELGDSLLPPSPDEAAEHARRLRGLIESSQSDRACVLGTGPSLDEAMAMNFSDVATIACNSMVRNDALMDHLEPVAVCCADPVFHYGPSSYAAAFREHLLGAMRRRPFAVVVPWRAYRTLASSLPGSMRDRLIAVPTCRAAVPNLDLRARAELVETGNIVTLSMFPLAASIAREVGIVGCDGRPMQENNYFWKHNAAAQLPERMNAAQRAHPGFFAIDYDEYYLQHCRTLDVWCDAAERSGRTVRSLTFSHIPALAERSSAWFANAPARVPA